MIKKKKRFLILLIILSVSPLIIALYENECCKDFCIINEEICSDRHFICKQSGSCLIGCCTDSQGFEHNNYPKEKCEKSNGRFYEGECRSMNICQEKVLY
ncbi:hypothetical protein CMI46_00840 [Candidatus Pacearchaeota archaeon]|nr:hypothetical protein [Candidatus Pacearchaeota archaeon]|tara:strand:- start:1194 stop:1493 length:300 start_codon:yes stop_codon:yes gene_type:complete